MLAISTPTEEAHPRFGGEELVDHVLKDGVDGETIVVNQVVEQSIGVGEAVLFSALDEGVCDGGRQTDRVGH